MVMLSYSLIKMYDGTMKSSTWICVFLFASELCAVFLFEERTKSLFFSVFETRLARLHPKLKKISGTKKQLCL